MKTHQARIQDSHSISNRKRSFAINQQDYLSNQKRQYLSVDRSNKKRRDSPFVNAKQMAKITSQERLGKIKLRKTQVDGRGPHRMNVSRRLNVLTMDNLLYDLPVSPKTIT